VDLYYWYFGTHAMFLAGGHRKAPKVLRAEYKAWGSAVEKAVVAHQCGKTEGRDDHGSWDPACAWGHAGGRVYATALCALILGTPHRYPRWFETADPDRTFLPDFQEAVRQGALCFDNLYRYAGGADSPKATPEDGGPVFRVLYLEPDLQKNELGDWVHVVGHFFFEVSSKKFLFAVPEMVDGALYLRLKKLKATHKVDMGYLSGYAEKTEREWLHEHGVVKSRKVRTYKGKLPIR
jgi:hypothetical protein